MVLDSRYQITCGFVNDSPLLLALCSDLLYWDSLGVWFFFSIAALTSKRSLVLMPESSAEEITVCPGKQLTDLN